MVYPYSGMLYRIKTEVADIYLYILLGGGNGVPDTLYGIITFLCKYLYKYMHRKISEGYIFF